MSPASKLESMIENFFSLPREDIVSYSRSFLTVRGCYALSMMWCKDCYTGEEPPHVPTMKDLGEVSNPDGSQDILRQCSRCGKLRRFK